MFMRPATPDQMAIGEYREKKFIRSERYAAHTFNFDPRRTW